MPRKIDLSPYFDKKFRENEKKMFATLPDKGPLAEEFPSDHAAGKVVSILPIQYFFLAFLFSGKYRQSLVMLVSGAHLDDCQNRSI